jgi:DNA (cytosine-5)-methyltransferase 1
MKKYTFIDVFSGCGGLSHGLELAGMKCLLGIDFNQDAIETFKMNHKDAQAYCGDVRELSAKEIRELTNGSEIDFVVGGPPCQGFSTVGKGQSEDPRNFLFLEFVRIVRETKPKGVLIENVTGLLAEKNKKVLARIFSIFQEMGYELEARVLSADEYGVAERRRRTIIIGTKKDYGFAFPIATHGARAGKAFRTVKDAFKTITKNASHNDPVLAEIKNPLEKERLKYIPEGCGIRYKADEEKYLPKKLRYDINWDMLAEGRFRQTKLQRLAWDKQSFTILTSRTMYYHPSECRYLTPREAAAIQSFPSDFKFYGSATSVFKQVGNAVPVELGRALGNSIVACLNGRVKKTKKVQDFKKYAFHYNKEVAA